MKSTTLNRAAETSAIEETNKFALGVGMSFASLVGVWGFASIVSALSQVGPFELVTSLFTAIGG